MAGFWKDWIKEQVIMIRNFLRPDYPVEWRDLQGNNGTMPVNSVVIRPYPDSENCSGVALGEIISKTMTIDATTKRMIMSIRFVDRCLKHKHINHHTINSSGYASVKTTYQYNETFYATNLQWLEENAPERGEGWIFAGYSSIKNWIGGGKYLPGRSFEWWRESGFFNSRAFDVSGWFPAINDYINSWPSGLPPNDIHCYPYDS